MSLALIKHQSSCKMLLCFYEFLIEILSRNISRLNLISLVGIFLCLTVLSSLVVIQSFYSTFLCMLQAFLNHVHTESLEVEPCLVKKAADEELILTKEEVEMVMIDLGIDCPFNDRKLREKMGVDDFAAVFEEEEPSLEEVKEAFDTFDVNKDGYIDEMELKSVLCVLGFKIINSEVECRKMIQVFDSDCDGRIDFHEFVRLIESSFC